MSIINKNIILKRICAYEYRLGVNQLETFLPDHVQPFLVGTKHMFVSTEIMNHTLDSQEMCQAKSITDMEGERLKIKIETDVCEHDYHGTRETQPLLPKTDLSSLNRFQMYPYLTSSTDPSSQSESTSTGNILATTSSSTDGCTSGSSADSLNSTHQSSDVLLQKNASTVGVSSNLSQQPHHHKHLHKDAILIKNFEEDCKVTATSQSHTKVMTDSYISTGTSSVLPTIKSEDNKISSSTSNRARSMLQIKTKYMSELDYMLREFKKLERQLSGAKACINGVEESSGSKERREKLRSFIIHLEDTIHQIQNGCSEENQAKQIHSTKSENLVKTDVHTTGNDQEEDQLSTLATKSRDGSHSESVGALNSVDDDQKHIEAVTRLEDHIRINLLPVKVRLSKQLAAQLGASQNPVGMPVARSGLPSIEAENQGKGTFAAAAEQKRLAQLKVQQHQQQSERSTLPSTTSSITNTTTIINNPVAEIHTQFGKPLGSTASSLTHKLHGETLGSESRPYGYGVGSKVVPDIALSSINNNEKTSSSRKMMVAGVAPGSDSSQIKSSVSSVTSAHRNFFENSILDSVVSPAAAKIPSQIPPKASGSVSSSINPLNTVANPLNPINVTNNSSVSDPVDNITVMESDRDCMIQDTKPIHDASEVSNHASIVSMTLAPRSPKKSLSDPSLTLEERAEIIRRRLQKKKRRLMSEQQPHHEIQDQNMALHLGEQNNFVVDGLESIIGSSSNHLKKSAKIGSLPLSRTISINRNGPKAVEYLCALCNETYTSTCDTNPWWTLNTQECPKCLKIQIPRIDISSSANEIEYHPALLVQAAEDNNVSLAINAEKINNSVLNQIKEQSLIPKTSNVISSGLKLYKTTGMEIKKEVEIDQDTASDLDFGPIDGDSLSTSDSDTSSDFGDNMSLAARAEHEEFGKEYSGPKFSDYDSSRLLVLMNHSSTCPGL